MDMWQKCPVCDGKGIIPARMTKYATSLSPIEKTCDVCNGEKIISNINGLPPSSRTAVPEPNKRNLVPRHLWDVVGIMEEEE